MIRRAWGGFEDRAVPGGSVPTSRPGLIEVLDQPDVLETV